MIYIQEGDATLPDFDENYGLTIIAHVVNDAGIMGAGFAQALSNRYPASKGYYLKIYAEQGLELGKCIHCPVRETLSVSHMIAMHGVASQSNPNPLDYKHLRTCLKKVHDRAQKYNAIVHMPKIGAGLARGNWDIIYPMIEEIFSHEVALIIWEYNG